MTDTFIHETNLSLKAQMWTAVWTSDVNLSSVDSLNPSVVLTQQQKKKNSNTRFCANATEKMYLNIYVYIHLLTCEQVGGGRRVKGRWDPAALHSLNPTTRGEMWLTQQINISAFNAGSISFHSVTAT